MSTTTTTKQLCSVLHSTFTIQLRHLLDSRLEQTIGDMAERDYTPEPVTASIVLGSLYYVDRKSGEVKQHYPCDAEKITFGRYVVTSFAV
jgi:hypothetical protein